MATKSTTLFFVVKIVYSSMLQWSLYSTLHQNPMGEIRVQQQIWECGCQYLVVKQGGKQMGY